MGVRPDYHENEDSKALPQVKNARLDDFGFEKCQSSDQNWPQILQGLTCGKIDLIIIDPPRWPPWPNPILVVK